MRLDLDTDQSIRIVAGDVLPRASSAMKPLLTRWTPGPAAGAQDGVLISVTDFTTARLRHSPDIIRSGLRLRKGWFAISGAIGLWLWSLPLVSRSGSISVWHSDEDLRRFVALPLHVEIMKRNRSRGSLRSTSWQSEDFSRAQVLERALAWIASGP